MAVRRRPVIGVMGAGEGARPEDLELARELGELIAREGWVLLTGGRDAGVMAAANDGAKRVAGSLTVGILPDAESPASPHVDVVIVTNMGNARNNINVLSSDVVMAVGSGGPGTASEVALALKAGKPVILLAAPPLTVRFFEQLDGKRVPSVATPGEAVAAAKSWLR